ncbi:hypothetical protein EKA93_06505 [Streptococcus pseudopneumoniae]|nr:hypothetical protein [Streptococcus pseudopneumoniae]
MGIYLFKKISSAKFQVQISHQKVFSGELLYTLRKSLQTTSASSYRIYVTDFVSLIYKPQNSILSILWRAT